MSPIRTENEQGAREYTVRDPQCVCERKYRPGEAYMIGYSIGMIGIPIYEFISGTVMPRVMSFMRGLNKESAQSEKPRDDGN